MLIIWVDVGTSLDQNVDCQNTVKSLYNHPIATNVCVCRFCHLFAINFCKVRKLEIVTLNSKVS